MPASSEIVEEQSKSVAATNLKVVAEGPAINQNLAYANAVSNQQGMNSIAAAIISKAAEMIIETKPAHAGGDIAALQMLLKGAQSTPPVTP